MLITDKIRLTEYRADQRIWQGIPGIEVTAKGRIFCCFYSGGTTEMNGNYCVVVQSDDGGKTFTEPIAAAYAGEDHRCFDPVLWIDPLGRLWFTWSRMPEHGLFGTICDDPDAEELIWGEEFFIGHDVMMNKPVVLSTGEWLFPLAVWDFPLLRDSWRNKTQQSGAWVYSTCDNGKSFRKLGAVQMPKRSFDEHMIAELPDGRLMMWVRTLYGIGVSYSWDRGNTWTKGEGSNVPSPSSRFYLGRLRSGRLLLVNHKNFTGRNNLTAMLSDDDGKTWSEGLLLDERKGVSYPDAVEARDGFVYIVYDHGRGAYKKRMEDAMKEDREILFAKVTEEDILAQKLVTRGSSLKNTVSRLDAYCGSVKNPYAAPKLFDDRGYARHLLDTGGGEAILSAVFEAYPLECGKTKDARELDAMIAAFADTGYADENLLTELIGKIRRIAVADLPIPPVIQKIREELAASLQEPLSLQELADRCKMSRYYLCHLFKTYTGTGPIAYRNELRLTMAKQALLHTNEKIGTIAASCGFDSTSYFSEIFFRSVGVSPSEYRKLHKAKRTE